MRKLPIEYVETRKKYLLFKNDCGVTDITRKGGIYEKYIFDYIREYIEIKGKNIIDVGANFGFHALEFADLVEDGKVYSFEPQRIVYYQLCANILLNGYDNIYAENVAMSDENTKLLMENPDYHSENTINVGDAHLNAYTDINNNEVDVKRLDDYNFSNVGVLKIDVQGYEPKVLDGAIDTIKRNKPVIFIEVEDAQLQVYGYQKEDVFDRLTKLGYTYKKVIDASHLVDYVAIFDETLSIDKVEEIVFDDSEKVKMHKYILENMPDSIHDIIPSEFFTKYDSYDYIWCKNYYEWNYAISKVISPKSYMEIGVRFGFSFLPALVGAPELEYALGWDLETYGNNSYAIDNLQTYYKGDCKWEIQHIDSQEKTEIPQFFDLVNLDGCHDFDCKIHDLNLAMNNSRYVLIDDYDYHPIVRQSVDKFIKDNTDRIEYSLYLPTFRGSQLIKFKIINE